MTVPVRERTSALYHSGHYVYICRDDEGTVLYVGCTTNVKDRLQRHQRATDWFADVVDTQVSDRLDRTTALDMETELIRLYLPVGNSRGKPAFDVPWFARLRQSRGLAGDPA
jgi:predicted GIY-YIG superfamily endonuclease